MATPPTILADSRVPSASSSAPVSSQTAVEAKFPLVPFLIAVVAGVVIAAAGVGGGLFYLIRTGRLPGREGSARRADAAPPAAPTHVMVLDPLLVNLADAGGSSYLKIAMTLRIADAGDGKDTKVKEEKPQERGANDLTAPVRDTLLTVLGRQTAEGLLAGDGKEKLKDELKRAFAEHNADLKVADVFFTDFLVQR
jgi:flagellar FliL protein